jgi:membrane protein YqaA with SNARE-associated domain
VGKLFYPIICKDEKGKGYLKSYHKYGRYGLLVSALGPIPYVPFCWFSGTFGLSIKNFLLFGIIPRILRILFVSYILVLFF